jgi:hypothetical protein
MNHHHRQAGRAFTGLVFLALLTLTGCKLEYASERFELTILPDGSGELALELRDFGSRNEASGARNGDLTLLKEVARDEAYVADAAAKGVNVAHRRLEFFNYTVNVATAATAADFHDFFTVLTFYTLEEDEKYYYLSPNHQTVLRADLSEGGKLVKRGKNGIAFRWPKSARNLSFTAEYQITGASFRVEFQRQYGH